MSYHFERGICEIDEFGKNLAIFAGGIQFCGIPQGEHGADELRKAFGPRSVGIRLALCMKRIKLADPFLYRNCRWIR